MTRHTARPSVPDGPRLRIRLVGTPEDCAAGVDALRLVLDVEHVSAPFPSREALGQVRVYVHATPRTPAPPSP
jgi:hypothetical protein